MSVKQLHEQLLKHVNQYDTLDLELPGRLIHKLMQTSGKARKKELRHSCLLAGRPECRYLMLGIEMNCVEVYMSGHGDAVP